MTQVSTNATGKPDHHDSADLSQNTSTSVPPARLLITGMLAVAGVSLALATRAPLTVTVLGLILFGVLHNILEIRYVAGRFASLLTGRFLILLLILTTGIALCRLSAQFWPDVARYAEIGIGYLILLAGCRIGLRGGWLVVAVAVLAVAAIGSFSYPAYHFVVLTHLHNLVPLIFLWDWARRIHAATGAAWLPADPGVVDRRPAAVDLARFGGSLDISRAGRGGPIRRGRQPGDRRSRAARSRRPRSGCASW